MTDDFLKWLKTLITDGNIHPFYISGEWLSLRREILKDDKNECQHCKRRGIYTRANTVHHVNHVKACPELALSKYYTDAEGNQKRNLISLCHNCHEAEHGHRVKHKKPPLTPERW